jgi:hypothetical protein
MTAVMSILIRRLREFSGVSRDGLGGYTPLPPKCQPNQI